LLIASNAPNVASIIATIVNLLFVFKFEFSVFTHWVLVWLVKFDVLELLKQLSYNFACFRRVVHQRGRRLVADLSFNFPWHLTLVLVT